ncbi:MAG: GreA/GreB family elongation factor, partial [Thermomicrobiales bacterium]|nr:GreA/GreB family elongation factor [Thermomicrobiales bacterium]
SENSEYEDLKEAFAITEARIQELEQTLANAVVLGPAADDGTVSLGSNVTIRDEDGMEETWVLVSPAEATAAGGAISTESPVGSALLGRCEGDSTTVETPVGPLVYTIVKVG